MAGSSSSQLSDKAFSIIAQETGVARDELEPDTEFSDLGVDDFLAKSIITKIAQETKLDLPKDVFIEYPTVENLGIYLRTITISNAVANSPPRKKAVPVKKPANPLSIILQGKPATAKQFIFLLPDGSGSGMAYMSLPPIGADICLIGMNSPYLHISPSEVSFVIEDTAKIWAEEIKKRQPVGPYVLGGWSAGGYYSYEVAKYLMNEGHSVEKLILIDSPCRLVFEALPMEVVEYLSTNNLMGNWGSKETPQWLVDHFDVSIKAIEKYHPVPMDENSDLPEVCVIWAEDTVLPSKIDAANTGLDLNVKVTRFLVHSRDGTGPHGWDGLFPGGKVSIATMPGNHFTIVHPPNSRHLTMLLRDSINEPYDRQGTWYDL